MKLTIHRGSKEIGGSCVEISDGKTRIIVDIGMPLVKSNGERFSFREYRHLKGHELIKEGVLPDVKGFYAWEELDKPIDALIISHAHTDHYGLLSFIKKDIPCYLGEGTKRLIELTNIFMGGRNYIHKEKIFESENPFQIGNFRITPFLMDHLAFDAYAFLIENNGKKIVYSGDFRAHGRKRKALANFLKAVPKGIDALMLEGSLINRSGESNTKTEEDIESDIIADIKDSDKPVLAMVSGQNIDRIVSFYKAAIKTKRLLVIDVYIANILNALKGLADIPHPSKSFSRIRVFYPYRLSEKLAKCGRRDLLTKFRNFRISREELAKNINKTLMLIRSSMLPDLKRMKGLEGSIFIYSMSRIYLKDDNMKSFNDFIKKQKMDMVYAHTSGHAPVETLQKVVSVIKPKKVIPIHTFNPEMYGDVFKDADVMEVSDCQSIKV